MNFYNRIHKHCIRYEEYSKNCNFNSFNLERYYTFKLVSIIIDNKTDNEFIIFYNKKLSQFKLNQKYYNKGYFFDRFIDANDFIEKILSPYINNENFYKEINEFIINIKDVYLLLLNLKEF